MNTEDIVEYCLNLQGECYDFYGRTSAPLIQEDYDEMVGWIEDQLRKSTVYDLLDEAVAFGCEDNGAYMAATAVAHILSSEGKPCNF